MIEDKPGKLTLASTRLDMPDLYPDLLKNSYYRQVVMTKADRAMEPPRNNLWRPSSYQKK